MEELIFDIAILLSGVGKNEKSLSNFIQKTTQAEVDNPDFFVKVTDDIGMHFYRGRRNMSLHDSKNDIHLRHRFTGHISLKSNQLGIGTFFREDFEHELDCLLGVPNANNDRKKCVQPDLIVMNSGLHDDKDRPVYYKERLRQVLYEIRDVYK